MKPRELLRWCKEGGALHYDGGAPLFSFLAVVLHFSMRKWYTAQELGRDWAYHIIIEI